MPEIVFHPNTRNAFERAISHQSHALLLIAPVGAGKSTAAQYLASELMGVTAEQLKGQAYFRHIGGEGTISVEDIRDLKQFLSLKTTGKATIRRVVTIENADAMNDESQNALLKALEEPPLDTVLILCASDIHALRDTIRSRSQTIQILPPEKQQIEAYFTAQGYSQASIEKAYRISGGLVGLMQAMLAEDSQHPLLVQIERAKTLLAASPFDRLKQVDELSKQKPELALLLAAFKRISSSALEQAARKGQVSTVKRWHATLAKVAKTEASLRHNPNLKLLLTDLFLAL